MVAALKDGDGMIHATWKEIADWAGVSYASVKRASIRLRALGWVRELPGGRIVFDYSRSVPQKAQIEPRPYKEVETFQEGCTHPEDQAPQVVSEQPPSGVDGPELEAGRDQESIHETPKPSVFGQAVAVLVEAGADRAGAVAAVKTARKGGFLDLGTIQRIAAAVAALPSKPYRAGGLLCDAVKRPELGRKILQDQAAVTRRKGSLIATTAALGRPQETPKANSAPSARKRTDGAQTCSLSPAETMRRTLRDWLTIADLAEPEDRAWILRQAKDRGWSLAELRTMPELRGL
jgi:hypothetical protein